MNLIIVSLLSLLSSSTADLCPKIAKAPKSGMYKQMPPASVMTRLILFFPFFMAFDKELKKLKAIGLQALCQSWECAR